MSHVLKILIEVLIVESFLEVKWGQTKTAPREKFEFFLKFCSEPEVEDILTIYTQENKSASVFLGAKKPKPKHDSTSR